MSYHSILIQLDGAPNIAVRIKLGVEWTSTQQAHLIGVALTGVPRFMPAGRPRDARVVLADHSAQRALERIDGAGVQFKEIAPQYCVTSRELRRRKADCYTSICQPAHYTELVILVQGRLEGSNPDSTMRGLQEYVVLSWGRPVQVVPESEAAGQIGRQPLIAWNDSAQAAKATTAALPLLPRARRVTVAIFDPAEGHAVPGIDADADIARYLAFHDIEAEFQQWPQAIDAGQAIVGLAAGIKADRIVMGAFGHSQGKHLMLGGATRTVLASAPCPVLMKH